jgi:hypothetical protein
MTKTKDDADDEVRWIEKEAKGDTREGPAERKRERDEVTAEP